MYSIDMRELLEKNAYLTQVVKKIHYRRPLHRMKPNSKIDRRSDQRTLYIRSKEFSRPKNLRRTCLQRTGDDSPHNCFEKITTNANANDMTSGDITGELLEDLKSPPLSIYLDFPNLPLLLKPLFLRLFFLAISLTRLY